MWSWPPQNCFINNFLIKDVQTKIQNVHTYVNDEQSNELQKVIFF